jgi:uncharacterized protein YndB with AHSA1/START domain
MKAFKPDPKLDLVLERVVDVPPSLVWDCWTMPRHLKKWFTPEPWKTIKAEVDLQPGGRFHFVMQSPEGENFPNTGCFLEVVKNERLTWTNALQPGYRPAVLGSGEMDFPFTAVVSMKRHGKGTKYTAMAIHRDEGARKVHEGMGFQDGWGKALDQLVALAKKL